MKCKNESCQHHDDRMTDNCAKGEPPDVEGCADRRGRPVERLVSLRWSLERPTDPGWYFVRVKGDLLDIEIVLVRGDTPTCPKYVLEHGRKDRYMLDRYTDECEWYGPLAVPEAN